jgi:fatty-acyl-CoA synthase
MNLALLLEMAAEGEPDRVVIGAPDTGLTTTELLARARRAATLFRARGVAHIGILDLNSEAVPIALFGAALSGLPFAPINYRLTDDQLHRIVGRLAPALVIAGGETLARVPRVDGLEVMSRVDFLAATAGEMSDGEVSGDESLVDPDEIAILLFTSGTTGEPKAAVLRHRHLTSYIINSVEFMGAGDDEAQLVSVPPYHIAGVSAILSSLYSGRRVLYLEAFDADAWIRTVSEHRVTQAMVVPTMLGRILDAVDQRDCAHELVSLRHLSYGGGRMPVELIERTMSRMPKVDYVNAYGLTETSSTVSVLTPDDHRNAFNSDDPAVRRRFGSVGRPLPSIEVEVRDAEGNALPAGVHGEVFVRGEQVAGEYLDTGPLREDGWFATRDAGYLDADGFLYLEGRLDDIIVRGAENLSPGEIEDTIALHPSVASAAVVGIPDPEWGEVVAAAVVLAAGTHATEAELKHWVRERLRSTKTPQLIEFRTELPYNETGKLLRRVLRAELVELNASRSPRR